jgi:hypothetical protein
MTSVRVGALAHEHPKSQAQQGHSTGAAAYGCVACVDDLFDGESRHCRANSNPSPRLAPVIKAIGIAFSTTHQSSTIISPCGPCGDHSISDPV